jgi:hypothetical protein
MIAAVSRLLFYVRLITMSACRSSRAFPRLSVVLTLCALSFGQLAHAEIPTVLTDTIKSGSGIIDVMKDVSPAELEAALSGGTLFLGADLNEDASGLEKSASQGVAIKEMELILQTTAGDFSFTDFYTNTTALILEAGSDQAAEFHTLFGQTGSNELSSSASDFDLSQFDDVIQIRNVDFAGEILGAQIRLSFLDTAPKAGDNESFFDYSAGFEDFAILAAADAQTLDNAGIGLAEAPTTVTYTAAAPSGGDLSAPSGAPEPHWLLLGAVPLILLARKGRS